MAPVDSTGKHRPGVRGRSAAATPRPESFLGARRARPWGAAALRARQAPALRAPGEEGRPAKGGGGRSGLSGWRETSGRGCRGSRGAPAIWWGRERRCRGTQGSVGGVRGSRGGGAATGGSCKESVWWFLVVVFLWKTRGEQSPSPPPRSLPEVTGCCLTPLSSLHRSPSLGQRAWLEHWPLPSHGHACVPASVWV